MDTRAMTGSDDDYLLKYLEVNRFEDTYPVKACEFHPSGEAFAFGSRHLRLCEYPETRIRNLREDEEVQGMRVQHGKAYPHVGFVNCINFSERGDVIATAGDSRIKLWSFDINRCHIDGRNAVLDLHSGPIRDLIFMRDVATYVLLSCSAIENAIQVTDGHSLRPYRALSGHTDGVLCLWTWGRGQFVSGSKDGTIKVWDIRTKRNVQSIIPPTLPGSCPGSPIHTLCAGTSKQILVCGKEDGACMVYDIRAESFMHMFRHQTTTVRFFFDDSCILASSKNQVELISLRYLNSSEPIPTRVVADHSDKILQLRCHPDDLSFLTASADKTVSLWAVPPHYHP